MSIGKSILSENHLVLGDLNVVWCMVCPCPGLDHFFIRSSNPLSIQECTFSNQQDLHISSALHNTKYIKSNLYSQIFSNVKTVMVEQPAIILQRLIWYLLVFDICISEWMCQKNTNFQILPGSLGLTLEKIEVGSSVDLKTQNL